MTILAEVPLLRQSERGVYKRCNWAWYQEYVRGIRPRAEIGMEAADFGTMFHVAMAEYYGKPGVERGPHPAETWHRLAKDQVMVVKTTGYVDDELVAKWEDFHELGLELANAYVEKYHGDPHWYVLDAERRFDVVIPDVRQQPLVSEKGRRGFRPAVVIVGTFDLCIRDLNDDKVKMVDHKTMGQIYTNHLTLDEQASTYITVATTALRHQGLIGPKDVVNGMEYNFIKRAKLDDRPRNAEGLACNQPQKKHYVDALIEYEDCIWDEEDRVGLMKWSKADLAVEAVQAHNLGPIFGEPSADQSSENFMRLWVPRTHKERQRQIVRISNEAIEMDMKRKGKLPVLKTPTKECTWCKFYDLCELDEAGGDTEYFIESTMKKHDPYADHRELAENSKRLTNGGEPDR